jgi:hypothetical protein
VPSVLAQRAVRAARNADGGTAVVGAISVGKTYIQ